jgi:hypothetical protein
MTEHKAFKILGRRRLSKKYYFWETPKELAELSKCDIYRFDTFIGFGRWVNDNEPYVVIAQKGELTYLEKDVFKRIYEIFKGEELKK